MERGAKREGRKWPPFNKSSADGRLIRKKSGTARRGALVIYVNAAEVGEPGPVIIVFSRMWRHAPTIQQPKQAVHALSADYLFDRTPRGPCLPCLRPRLQRFDPAFRSTRFSSIPPFSLSSSFLSTIHFAKRRIPSLSRKIFEISSWSEIFHFRSQLSLNRNIIIQYTFFLLKISRGKGKEKARKGWLAALPFTYSLSSPQHESRIFEFYRGAAFRMRGKLP